MVTVQFRFILPAALLIFLLLSTHVSAKLPDKLAGFSNETKVEQAVLSALESGGSVQVIVKLKEPAAEPKGLVTATSAEMKIAAAVPKEFKLSRVHKTINAFSGTADRKAVEELESNPGVEGVYLVKEYHA
jgi:hypothetical protein